MLIKDWHSPTQSDDFVTERPESSEDFYDHSDSSACSDVSGDSDTSTYSAYSSDSALSVTAVEACVPESEKAVSTMLFRLARHVAAVPEIISDIQASKQVCREWFDRTLSQGVVLPNFDDVRANFLYMIERVRCPIGTGPDEQAWRNSSSSIPPPEAGRFESPEVRRLLVWLRDLQVIAGPASDIYLSTHLVASKLSEWFGYAIQSPQVWRWMKMFEAEKLLECVTRGDARRATRYRYLGTLEEQIYDPVADGDQPF